MHEIKVLFEVGLVNTPWIPSEGDVDPHSNRGIKASEDAFSLDINAAILG